MQEVSCIPVARFWKNYSIAFVCCHGAHSFYALLAFPLVWPAVAQGPEMSTISVLLADLQSMVTEIRGGTQGSCWSSDGQIHRPHAQAGRSPSEGRVPSGPGGGSRRLDVSEGRAPLVSGSCKGFFYIDFFDNPLNKSLLMVGYLPGLKICLGAILESCRFENLY